MPVAIPGYDFVRRGCPPTGWARSADLLYVCAQCESRMPAAHDDYFTCSCAAMSLDHDAGRFGSRLGDDAILVYRAQDRDLP